MSKQQQIFRPLISSLSFYDQQKYLPLRYNSSIQQVQSIKKYLPKQLFKFFGVDINADNISPDIQEKLKKTKLKIKAKKGVNIQTNTKLEFVPKQQVKIIQWYNKTVDVRIPYNPKQSTDRIETLITNHLANYAQKCILIKNTLTDQLYKADEMNKSFSVDQISLQTDIILTSYGPQAQAVQVNQKVLQIQLPIILCLNYSQSYSLFQLKETIKNDLLNSLSIMMKNNFNTKVFLQGHSDKQFICLHSFCQANNALQEQNRLKALIGQSNLLQPAGNQQMPIKQKRFLILVLIFLAFIYTLLKIFPINGRDYHVSSKVNPHTYTNDNNNQQNEYTNQQNDQFNQNGQNNLEEQIF